MQGYKHLISCKCILPQFSKLEDPPFHKFLVFSVVDDEDVVKTKFCQCNNCGAIHKIIDFCTSEILNKDEIRTLVDIEDIKINLDPKLVAVLERYQVDVATWEAVAFIIDNERWGEFVTLTNDEIDGTVQRKYIRIMGRSIFKVESHTQEIYI